MMRATRTTNGAEGRLGLRRAAGAAILAAAFTAMTSPAWADAARGLSVRAAAAAPATDAVSPEAAASPTAAASAGGRISLCPGGGVVVGLHGAVSADGRTVTRLGALCQDFGRDGRAVSAVAEAPAFGAEGGRTVSLRCPDGRAVAGLRLRLGEGRLDQTQLICAEIRYDWDAHRLVRAANCKDRDPACAPMLSRLGGNGGVRAPDALCPGAGVARGFRLQARPTLSTLELRCL